MTKSFICACLILFAWQNAAAQEEIIFLLVDKSQLTATLMTLPEEGRAPSKLRSFSVAVGKETGDKFSQGDNRTPEGIYLTSAPITGSGLDPKVHGPVAIPLNYPNPMDRIEGKTGYGIWLHGAGNDDRIAKANVTKGCVAFYNGEIVKLKDWLLPDRSIVAITADSSHVNLPQDTQTLFTRTNAWIKAWEARDINHYGSFYAEDFEGAGGKKGYMTYKKRIFAGYRSMVLQMDHVRVISHPKYAVSIMNQHFKGDRFVSNGRKILYWEQQGGNWNIVKERFEPRHFAALRYSADDLESLNNSAHLQTSSLLSNQASNKLSTPKKKI